MVVKRHEFLDESPAPAARRTFAETAINTAWLEHCQWINSADGSHHVGHVPSCDKRARTDNHGSPLTVGVTAKLVRFCKTKIRTDTSVQIPMPPVLVRVSDRHPHVFASEAVAAAARVGPH